MDPNRVYPKDIHKGDRLWDSGQYGSVEFIVKDEPTHIDGKWEWIAITNDGEDSFLITDGFEHYGPRIYKKPVYLHDVEPLNQDVLTREDKE